MIRAALLALSLTLVGCSLEAGAPRERLELELGVGQARLALTDPALLAPLKSFVALMYVNHGGVNTCADLVDADLPELLARGPLASQVVALEGAGRSDEHAFGNVGASGVHSFLLLGSLKPKGLLKFEVEGDNSGGASGNPLVEGAGSVIAVGCEEVDVRQYQRFDVSISLFPAGLR